jgi:hypothetical protein
VVFVRFWCVTTDEQSCENILLEKRQCQNLNIRGCRAFRRRGFLELLMWEFGEEGAH